VFWRGGGVARARLQPRSPARCFLCTSVGSAARTQRQQQLSPPSLCTRRVHFLPGWSAMTTTGRVDVDGVWPGERRRWYLSAVPPARSTMRGVIIAAAASPRTPVTTRAETALSSVGHLVVTTPLPSMPFYLQ